MMKSNVTIEDAKKQKESVERAILSVLKNLCEETGLKLDSISFKDSDVGDIFSNDFYSVDDVSIELKL